jgi:hypothetical protein
LEPYFGDILLAETVERRAAHSLPAPASTESEDEFDAMDADAAEFDAMDADNAEFDSFDDVAADVGTKVFQEE